MKCPHCKKEIDRKKIILKYCVIPYSITELARKLDITASSVCALVKTLEFQNKVKVNRLGPGRKTLITTLLPSITPILPHHLHIELNETSVL